MKNAIRIVLAAALFAALAPIVFAVACTTPSILTPKVGPGTDRPCSYLVNGNIVSAHSCGTQADGTKTCCDDGSDCGGVTPGCPAGSCCWHGDEGVFGARRPVSHRPEK